VSQRSLPMHLAELPSKSELGEVDISRWLMTRRNVASYDCRSDVSAGLPGIAYVRQRPSGTGGVRSRGPFYVSFGVHFRRDGTQEEGCPKSV
jgi:hypothetical protein